MFNTFKLRWFPLFAVFTPLNVWTDEGQPCEKIRKLLDITGFSHVYTPLHNCGDSDI